MVNLTRSSMVGSFLAVQSQSEFVVQLIDQAVDQTTCWVLIKDLLFFNADMLTHAVVYKHSVT
jgi:hypothetical protein